MMFDRSAKLALLVAATTLAICGVGFRIAVRAVNAYLEKQPVPLRDQLTNIPKRLGAWHATGEDIHLTVELEEALGTADVLDRTYVRGGRGRGQPWLAVHVTYYTGFIDAVPHVPDRCLAAHGWTKLGLPRNLALPVDRDLWRPDPEHTNLRNGRPYPLLTFRHHITGRPVTVAMPFGDFMLRTTEFRDSKSPDVRIYAGYFFIANGETTPSPEAVRSFAFDLSTKFAYYTKVQFSMLASGDTDEETFIGLVSDFVGEFLPELIHCLPDWREVEAGSTAASPEPAA